MVPDFRIPLLTNGYSLSTKLSRLSSNRFPTNAALYTPFSAKSNLSHIIFSAGRCRHLNSFWAVCPGFRKTVHSPVLMGAVILFNFYRSFYRIRGILLCVYRELRGSFPCHQQTSGCTGRHPIGIKASFSFHETYWKCTLSAVSKGYLDQVFAAVKPHHAIPFRYH